MVYWEWSQLSAYDSVLIKLSCSVYDGQIMGHMKEFGCMQSALICSVSRLCLAQELSHWFLKTKTRLQPPDSDWDIYCSWSGAGKGYYPSISVVLWQCSFSQSPISICHRTPLQQAAVTRDSDIPYPTAFPYGNGMVLHFYQQQKSSTTKTVHKVINKGLKAYV